MLQHRYLEFPKLPSSTGKFIGEADNEAIEYWFVTKIVVGMCFDITALNKGLVGGVCTHLEQTRVKEVLYPACQHCIF